MRYRYALLFFNRNDLKRICELLTKHAEIMKILNEDSRKSPEGGAQIHYEVRIELEEKWV